MFEIMIGIFAIGGIVSGLYAIWSQLENWNRPRIYHNPLIKIMASIGYLGLLIIPVMYGYNGGFMSAAIAGVVYFMGTSLVSAFIYHKLLGGD